MTRVFVFGNRDIMQNYDEALTQSGFEAVFSKDAKLAEGCDALLLPGGSDIDPSRYGQENRACFGIDETRDAGELELIRMFSETSRPILGICRGLQVLNVAFGGTLHQDIETAAAHKWEESTGDKVHRILTSEESFLRPLYGESFFVNSAHHQAIDELAPNLTVTARAEDGVIEAVEDCKNGVYAVQWHPERMAFGHRRADTVDGRFVFEFFRSLF